MVVRARLLPGLTRRIVLSSIFLALILLSSFLGACGHRSSRVLTVSAAASLTDALQQVESAFHRDHPEVDFRNNFGSSGTLANQIKSGAPVDIFLSAASGPMDELQSGGLLVPNSRFDLLRNSLVLVVARGSTLSSFSQLASPGVRNIAIGDPASVPAGLYAQQALKSLGLLQAVRARLVLARDVRQVLAYVETGNADAGLVYATDAAISSKVRVAAAAPGSSHDPIVYPVAAISPARNDTAAFLGYLRAPVSRAIFVHHGFTMALQ